jgi:hypothetical protein
MVPGTANNPHFSLREFEYEGYPMVEVLKNGGQVTPWDEHFQFGQRKAEIFVACMEILRKFWQSNDDQRRAFPLRVVEKSGLCIQVNVEREFVYSTGEKIYCPFLRLETLSPPAVVKGVGATKCQALCALENDLNEWLLKHQPHQRLKDLLSEMRLILHRIQGETHSPKVSTPAEAENPASLESKAVPSESLSKDELWKRLQELAKEL